MGGKKIRRTKILHKLSPNMYVLRQGMGSPAATVVRDHVCWGGCFSFVHLNLLKNSSYLQ